MTQPSSVPADGALKVLWVPVIAITTAPTVAELTAAGVRDVSCYLTAEGFSPSTDEQAITDERLCSRQTFQRRGRFADSLDLSYIYNPNSAADNLAYSTMSPSTLGYIVARWGLAYETAIVAAQVVDVHPAECGIRQKQPPTANTVFTAKQKIFIRAGVQRDVAVAP
jgi:hypothetical protein